MEYEVHSCQYTSWSYYSVHPSSSSARKVLSNLDAFHLSLFNFFEVAGNSVVF